jgi:hypothetical protein
VRAGWGLFAFALLVVLGGCRVDTTVEARVTGAGGAVTARFVLDREAVALLGGTVSEAAQETSDLRQAGWEIAPLRQTGRGGAEIEIKKAFHRPGDLGVVIGELAGPDGPLREFRLDRSRGFSKARYRLRGTADLKGGAAATGFANTPDLPARLRDAGVDPDRVAELLAGRAADGLRFRLVVALPGKTRSWAVETGSPQPVDVASSVTTPARPALLAVAVVTGLIVLLRLRRRPGRT